MPGVAGPTAVSIHRAWSRAGRSSGPLESSSAAVPETSASMQAETWCVGVSLTLADAYATSGFAMGDAGVGWVAARPGYAPFAVTAAGRVRYSDAFADLLVSGDTSGSTRSGR